MHCSEGILFHSTLKVIENNVLSEKLFSNTKYDFQSFQLFTYLIIFKKYIVIFPMTRWSICIWKFVSKEGTNSKNNMYLRL